MAAITSLVSAGGAVAEEDDRAAVLALMGQAFAAVSSGDPDDWRAIQLAEGTSLSFRAAPEGHPTELEMRISTNEANLPDQIYLGEMERWTDEPTVLIHGPIAVVWGPYEYWIDDAFSHCGIDSADLVKVNGEWKIANWMWTVEKENCPTDPARQEQ